MAVSVELTLDLDNATFAQLEAFVEQARKAGAAGDASVYYEDGRHSDTQQNALGMSFELADSAD